MASSSIRDVTGSSRKPSPRDWEDIKAEVFRLYIEEEQSLKRTMDWFRQNHQFNGW
jgi:hypothetical protein